MEFILANLNYITPIITALVAWFASRKLKKAELKEVENRGLGGELDNISQNFKVYQGLINDLEGRFKGRITELELDLERFKILNEELRTAVARQEEYISVLREKLDKYEKLEGQN